MGLKPERRNLMNPTNPTAAQQVDALKAQLTQTLAARADLHDQLEHNQKTLVAIRNALNGVDIGARMVNDAVQKAIAERSASTPKNCTCSDFPGGAAACSNCPPKPTE
jgi:hypothetical protein